MALVPSISVSQQIGLNDTVTITDTSTGSDGAIVSRVVFIQIYDNNYLVPTGTSTNYTVWAYADASIPIACLDKDYGVLITVRWLDNLGATLYEFEDDYGLTSYNEDFDITLSSVLSSNPLLVDDNSFKQNKFNLRLFIDSGDKAILRSSDLFSAQQCYDLATALRLGSEYYFNESNS